MDFPTWSLDATTLIPLTLTSDVSFSFEDVVNNNVMNPVPIQSKVTILIAFTMPVPVEKSGCFVKYTFPNDFQLLTQGAGSYIYQGYNIMRTSVIDTANDPTGSEGGDATRYSDNIEFSKGNYVIFKGCTELDGNYQTPKIAIKNVQSPNADKTTNEFKIEMFKEQSETDVYTLSNPIISGKGIIDAAVFTSG